MKLAAIIPPSHHGFPLLLMSRVIDFCGTFNDQEKISESIEQPKVQVYLLQSESHVVSLFVTVWNLNSIQPQSSAHDWLCISTVSLPVSLTYSCDIIYFTGMDRMYFINFIATTVLI